MSCELSIVDGPLILRGDPTPTSRVKRMDEVHARAPNSAMEIAEPTFPEANRVGTPLMIPGHTKRSDDATVPRHGSTVPSYLDEICLREYGARDSGPSRHSKERRAARV